MILFRLIFWLLIWILTLGFVSIDVEYPDGMSIKIKGWIKYLNKKGD